MSIKLKLSLFILLISAVMLTLNIGIYYYSSRENLKQDLEKQMQTVAGEIGITVENSRYAAEYFDRLLAEKLRMASIAAQAELSPDIAQVTNGQLIALSEKLGVTHISLLKETADGDIKVLKSSDPKEINLSTKDWGYWHQAMRQLLAGESVTVKNGQQAPYYWSGPFEISGSDPNHVTKWGYYYDGTTNYIIDPSYIRDDDIKEFDLQTGTAAIMKKSLQTSDILLEITGINPDLFGKPAKLSSPNGISFVALKNRPIIFGDYKFANEHTDANLVAQAMNTSRTVSYDTSLAGKHVFKSFIPVHASPDYVICLVTDYGVIQNVLNKQLSDHIITSLVILILVVAVSYAVVGLFIRPLRVIVSKVVEISAGQFGVQVPTKRKDELGVLASRINAMSNNLRVYTYQLEHAVEEARSTKAFLESFFNQTSDAIHVLTFEGEMLHVNSAFVSLYGWESEEMLGKLVLSIPEHLIEEFFDLICRVRDGECVSAFETVRRTKDGRLLDVSITLSPIRDENGEIMALACITRDITERRHTEELLRRSEKLSVIGQLAAGVAHEIRNPLTTVKGFVQLLIQRGHGNPQHLALMSSELDRINFIVSEFLILSKPQVTNFQSRDLRTIIRDINVLIDTQAKMNNVQILIEMDDELPNIRCEEIQLKQVFINLLKNSIEAMTDGGELTIGVKKRGERDVEVRIADQGSGIRPEHLPRLGEPFFTNKENGNGLGLMVSQQIIANHKGAMHISSTLGKGTLVELVLPVA